MTETARRVRSDLPRLSGVISVNIQAVPVEPIIALVAGVVILVSPGLLNYIVAIYLIVIGLIGVSHRLIS